MLLIDGNNLWHAAVAAAEPLAGISMSDLLGVIERFAQQRQEETVIVLDGRPRQAKGPDSAGRLVRRVYAGPRSADDVIAEIVSASSNPRGMTLVSSDRQLRRAVRRRRVRLIGSEAFAADLAGWLARQGQPGRRREPAGKTTGLGGDHRAIDNWLRYLDPGGKTANIMDREQAGSADGGLSQPADTSSASRAPQRPRSGSDLSAECARAFAGAQPLKRRKRRR